MSKKREPKITLKVLIPVSIDQWLRENVPYGEKTKFVIEALQKQIDTAKKPEKTKKPKPAELTKVEEEIYQLLLPEIERTMKLVYGKHYPHMPIDDIIVSIYFAGSGAINRYNMSKEVEEYWRENKRALMFDKTTINELLEKLSNRLNSDNKAEEPEEFNTRINDLMTIRDLLVKLRCPREQGLDLRQVAGYAGVSYQTAYNKISPILIKLGYIFKDARQLSKFFTFDNL